MPTFEFQCIGSLYAISVKYEVFGPMFEPANEGWDD